MPTIRTDDGVMNVVNVFTCEPENQQRLLDTLASETRGTVATLPGFISSSLHTSLDGRRVCNYAQWSSLEAFQDMMSSPSGRELIANVHRTATNVDIGLYRVAQTFETVSDRGMAARLASEAWAAVESDDFVRLARLFDGDAEFSTSGGTGRGADYACAIFRRHRASYPDLHHRVLSTVESAAGNAVAMELEFTGTQLGELRGPIGTIPPTGRTITWRSSDHVVAQGERIVSWHAHFDRLAMLQALTQPEPPMASVNKQTVRRILLEAFGDGRVNVLNDVLTAGFVNHSAPPGVDSGVEGVKQIIQMERAGIPDLTYEIEREIEEGDIVVQQAWVSGTHSGVLFGVPPTHRPVRWREMHFARMENGRCAEHWGVTDMASLWVQIGRAQPPMVRLSQVGAAAP